MNKKLLLVSLFMLVFCLLTPCVSAKAETTRDILRQEDSGTITATNDLPPGSTYTQVKTTITFTTEYSGQYHAVLDAKGNMHLNVKLVLQTTMEGEALFWDTTLQDWVSGQTASQTSKRIIIYNDLIVDSETQTSRELLLSRIKYSSEGISPDNGESYTLEFTLIRHAMFKMANGELQFQHQWEIVKGTPRLPI